MHVFLVKVVNHSYVNVMRICKMPLNWIMHCIRLIVSLPPISLSLFNLKYTLPSPPPSLVFQARAP